MEFKGTKGKWLAGSADMQDTGEQELVVFPEGRPKLRGGYKLICCISPMPKATIEDIANAKLIAHAPEVLEKLKHILGLVEYFGEWDEEADSISQLIKKATTV